MKRVAGLVLLLTLLAWSTPARAEDPKTTAKDEVGTKAEGAAAEEERPKLAWIDGPKRVDLGHKFFVDLPAGYALLPKEDARKVLENMGNQQGDGLMGLIVHGEDQWFVKVSYEDSGYVRDDEAEKLDGTKILEDIKEGTQEANEYRKENGFPEVFVDGWVNDPSYEKATHRMVWGIKGHSERGSSVNFNTRVLGRFGVTSLNLIASPEDVETAKPHALALLAASGFEEGARYADFVEGKDKVSEYGLAALVAGGAGAMALKAAKIGIGAKLLSKLGVILLASKKLIGVVLIGLFALLKALFGREKKEDTATAQHTPPQDPPAAG
jgi:uncharacterized membrane-anchored protein